jgi:hypothetical protein
MTERNDQEHTVRLGRLGVALAVAAAFSVACGPPAEGDLSGCAPDEVMECACIDGTTGTQTCLEDGLSLSPCECPSGAAPSPTSPDPSPTTEPSPPPTTAPTTEPPIAEEPAPTSPTPDPSEPTPTPEPEPVPTPTEPDPVSSLPADHCMSGITNYTTSGPFSYTTRTVGQVKFWVPSVPAGCKVPITHLANGTGASCSTYRSILQHMASHGFLTTCYESTATGQGTQCLQAIETALSQYPDLADHKVGSTGHSQGGGGAIMCVYRTEQAHGNAIRIVGHAMEPAHGYGDSPSNWATLYGQIQSPIFMFNGSSDSLVSASWVRRGYNALSGSVEAYWYEAVGAAHIPVPTRWTQESTVPWFRWKLLGDRQACEYFKNMPNTSSWRYMASKNETDC